MTEGQITEEELKNMSPEEIAALQKKNCVFCKIVGGEVPSHKVFSDNQMIAIMDIYPSTKGHVLVLPKEHVPIMPLLKPETFKHIFKNVKYLSRGVREGTPSANTTIFIANGAVAGQQSPHFLFHIIPREKSDNLKFEIPKNKINQDELYESFKTNLTKIMNSHLQREGKPLSSKNSEKLVQNDPKKMLAKFIEDNPALRDMLKDHPEEVKKGLSSNPELAKLFQGVNIDKLSLKLKEYDEDSEEELPIPKPIHRESLEEEVEPEIEEKDDSSAEISEEDISDIDPSEVPKPTEYDEEEKDDKKNFLDNITHLFSK